MDSAIEDAITDETPIWRYMDLPKFISMLATGGLWFTRAAMLKDDPFEGFCRAVAQNIPGTTPLEQMFASISCFAAQSCENAPNHLYVSSWCLACESMAMWQIYGSLACGVAVKSTVKQYQNAARFNVPPWQYMFGKVKYHSDLELCPELQRDFSLGSIPQSSNLWNSILKLGFHKRSCYEYENEWRAALYQDSRPEITGVHVPFDLDRLITAVYVGPRAEEFLVEAVSSVMDKYALGKPLEHSALLRPPQKEADASAG